MKKFKVNTNSMEETYRASRAEIDSLKQALQDMRTSVSELNATWSGSNSVRFASGFRESCDGIERLIAVLDVFVETYSKAADVYESCESEVMGLASY